MGELTPWTVVVFTPYSFSSRVASSVAGASRLTQLIATFAPSLANFSAMTAPRPLWYMVRYEFLCTDLAGVLRNVCDGGNVL